MTLELQFSHMFSPHKAPAFFIHFFLNTDQKKRKEKTLNLRQLSSAELSFSLQEATALTKQWLQCSQLVGSNHCFLTNFLLSENHQSLINMMNDEQRRGGEGGTEYRGKEKRWETLCETEDGEREPGGNVCREWNCAVTHPRAQSRAEENRGLRFSNLLALKIGGKKKSSLHFIATWPESLFDALQSHTETHIISPQRPNTCLCNPQNELRWKPQHPSPAGAKALAALPALFGADTEAENI